MSTAVGAMVTTPDVNSQATMVQTYPGLPPVVELIPDIKTSRKQTADAIGRVFSAARSTTKKLKM